MLGDLRVQGRIIEESLTMVKVYQAARKVLLLKLLRNLEGREMDRFVPQAKTTPVDNQKMTGVEFDECLYGFRRFGEKRLLDNAIGIRYLNPGNQLPLRDVSGVSGPSGRSGFKTPSKARWLRCRPPQNAHILPCMLRFFVGLRLALEPDLRF